ncbi:hypothetical protein N8878_05630 [Psychromonas sp.]|nr:hypothetical protein [Psychromonas sp.]
MKNIISVLMLIYFCFSSLPIYAQTLSNYSVRKVMLAHELHQEDKLVDAIAVLQEYQATDEYDKAYINRMLAGFYWQNGDTKNTILRLTLAVDSQELPVESQRETLTMLAEVLIANSEYSRSEQRYYQLLPLIKDNNKTLELTWLRIAQTQYQQRKWSLVETSIEKQQYFQKITNIKPQVMPLNMLLGAQLAQEKWKSAIKTADSLRELEPKNVVWWQQLISLYMQNTDHSNALITLQQADRAELELSNDQLTLMAQLYAQSGVPYQAANTYLRLKNIEMDPDLMAQQAIYWQRAKEWQRALKQWDRAAQIKPAYYREYALLAVQRRELENALIAIDNVPEQDAALLLIKAQILNEMGNIEHALNTVIMAHQLAPSDKTETWVRFLTQAKKAKTM